MNHMTKTDKFAVESAFLPKNDSSEHIVDVLIKERCPKLAAHWTWPITRPIFHSILGYKPARNIADHIIPMTGKDGFDYISQWLNLHVNVMGLKHVPKSGRIIVVANHPTGLADGIAVWDSLRGYREDIMFMANADILRVNLQFEDVIIPVEWVEEKRSPAKARETLKRANAAFDDERCLIIFPSGKLARKIGGRMWEQEWFHTMIGFAKKQKADIIPLHINAMNSTLYYYLSRLNPELRDITLFHELLNKKNKRFDLTIGPPISYTQLSGSSQNLANQIRNYVSYQLAGQPERSFIPKKSDS